MGFHDFGPSGRGPQSAKQHMHSKDKRKQGPSVLAANARSTNARGKYEKSSTAVETSVLLLAMAIRSDGSVQSFTESDSVR